MAMRKQRREKGTSPLYAVLFVALLVVVVGGAMFLVATPPPKPAADTSHQKMVLDPAKFKGEVREGYQIARDIPGVLSQLNCHCGCDNPQHTPYHRSLLECFTDDHGANCVVCVQEALMASRMNSQGANIGQIRNAIDSKFRS